MLFAADSLLAAASPGVVALIAIALAGAGGGGGGALLMPSAEQLEPVGV